MSGSLHEDLARAEEVAGPSDRKFGLTVGSILLLLGCASAYYHSNWAYGLIPIGAVLATLGLARPGLLAVPNKLWLKLGLLLNRIVSPIIMAVLYAGVMVPIGMLLRALGKDLLSLKKHPDNSTYWVERADDRPLTQSMRQQF